jgi:hypothetical protein
MNLQCEIRFTFAQVRVLCGAFYSSDINTVILETFGHSAYILPQIYTSTVLRMKYVELVACK